MITRYEAYMDGVALSSISPDIIVLDIGHAVANPSIAIASVFKRNGNIVMSESMNGSQVTISFEIHAYNIQKRQEILQRVIKWAKGNILETNDRKDQRLHAKCTAYPTIESALSWTTPISMTFAGFEKPFWEEGNASVLVLEGDDEEGYLNVPGNAGTALVEVEIVPQASLANITLTVGNTSMTLTGISATTSDTVKISYDGKGFLSIKKGTTSLLDKRTGSDDLLAVCGELNEVSIDASADVEVTFTTRGVWL